MSTVNYVRRLTYDIDYTEILMAKIHLRQWEFLLDTAHCQTVVVVIATSISKPSCKLFTCTYKGVRMLTQGYVIRSLSQANHMTQLTPVNPHTITIKNIKLCVQCPDHANWPSWHTDFRGRWMQKCSICFNVFYLLYCETAFRPLYHSPIDKETVTYGSGSVTQGD